MKRYEKYKDSGVDWIGEVPENWEIVRFKRLFNEKKKITDASLNSGSISFGEIIYKDDEKITEATKLSYQVLNSGEFLLNPLNMNYDLKSLRIGLSTINVVVSSGYIVLQSKKGLNKNYYKWLLRMYDVVFMKTLGAGVRQTINYNDLADSHLVVPSLNEQQTIATFLDEKTTKIDQTITIKQKEIELLKERRQILIQKAVTKGLNDNVKMKDSGVDWIGEIPEHWEVRKLKQIGIFINGYAFDSNEFKEDGIKVMKISNVQTMKTDWSDLSLIDSKYYDKLERFRVLKGDLVFALTRPIISTGIKATIISEDDKILLNQRNSILRTKMDFDVKWFYFILLDKMFIQEFENNIDKTGQQPNISTFRIGNIYVPFPSADEILTITHYLEDIEEKISKAISLKQQEIERLKEYKTVLIDNVVTGKVRVS